MAIICDFICFHLIWKCLPKIMLKFGSNIVGNYEWVITRKSNNYKFIKIPRIHLTVYVKNIEHLWEIECTLLLIHRLLTKNPKFRVQLILKTTKINFNQFLINFPGQDYVRHNSFVWLSHNTQTIHQKYISLFPWCLSISANPLIIIEENKIYFKQHFSSLKSFSRSISCR